MSHDTLFKKSLEDPKVAKDFFAAHLPIAIQKCIDLTTLKIENGSFIDNEYQKFHTDMLFSVNVNKAPGLLYLLTEHQSSLRNAKFMPLRMLEYVVRILNHYQDKDTGMLPIVIPLVYYHGTTSPYPYSTDILDYFAEPELAKAVMFKPFNLIDLTVMPDDAIEQHKNAAMMEMLHKHAFARDNMPALRFMYHHGLFNLLSYLNSEYSKVVVKYIYYQTDSDNKEDVTDLLLLAMPYAKEQIMTLGQRYAQEGSQERAYQIAKNLLAEGANDVFIAKVTKLSLDEIDKIKKTEELVN